MDLEEITQRRICDVLSRHQLNFVWTPSEEAQVWRVVEPQPNHRSDVVAPHRDISNRDISISPKTLAWVKRHRASTKASREHHAILTWGSLLGAPRVIQCVDDRTLLLEHCSGLTIEKLGSNQALGAELLGAQVAMLHERLIKDEDNLPLLKAIAMRAQTALSDTSLQTSISADFGRDVYDQAVHLITELKTPRVAWSTLSDQAYALLTERIPCHRDLTGDHLRFSNQETLHLRVLDWGQSRLDSWTSDWVKLSVEWSDQPDLWQSAWCSYWQRRTHHVHHTERSLIKSLAYTELNRALALQAINTLRWSKRHRIRQNEYADEVWSRGVKELSVMMKRRR